MSINYLTAFCQILILQYHVIKIAFIVVTWHDFVIIWSWNGVTYRNIIIKCLTCFKTLVPLSMYKVQFIWTHRQAPALPTSPCVDTSICFWHFLKENIGYLGILHLCNPYLDTIARCPGEITLQWRPWVWPVWWHFLYLLSTLTTRQTQSCQGRQNPSKDWLKNMTVFLLSYKVGVGNLFVDILSCDKRLNLPWHPFK